MPPISSVPSAPFEHGHLHRPEAPVHGLALTHGAGADCTARLLVAVGEALELAGVLVYRYDLPFRRGRHHGPPFPALSKADREGVREAVSLVRSLVNGKVLAGGHSYGGRQTSMAAAEYGGLADGLLLLSYPLHPPKKPDQLRTAHFPNLTTRSLFVQGTADPFGSEEELRIALKEVPAPFDLLLLKGGHDLGRDHAAVARAVANRVTQFLLA